MENIYRHEMALWERLRQGLSNVEGVKLYCQDSAKNHLSVFLFNVEGMEAGDVGTLLDVDHNIACRTGLHCAPMVHEHLGTDKLHGAVRLGIGVFNTEAHIDTAIHAVQEIAAMALARTR